MAREIGGLWRLIPHEPTPGEIEDLAADDDWFERQEAEWEEWTAQHPHWGEPVERRMVFCPRGCNCIETTVRYEECAGWTM